MKRLIAICAALAIGYVLYPHITLWRLGNAILDRNTAVMDSLIDWPKVRNGLRAEIMGAISRGQMSRNGDQSSMEAAGGMLGMALGGPIVDRALESFASSRAMIEAFDKAEVKKLPSEWLQTATFASLATFHVTIRNPTVDGPAVGFLMRLEGLEWRIVQVILPPEFHEAMKRSNRS